MNDQKGPIISPQLFYNPITQMALAALSSRKPRVMERVPAHIETAIIDKAEVKRRRRRERNLRQEVK